MYLPYECTENEDEYLNRLAYLHMIVQDMDCSCIYIMGDMNADISDTRSMFGNHLKQFCTDSGLILSSQIMLLATPM